MPEETSDGIDLSAYNRWHFYPYTDADEYSPENPLYAFVAGVEGRGEIMVYVRPPASGAFHSADPEHTDITPRPPSDALKNAFADLLTNAGEKQDISRHLPNLKPWEHHFIEIVMALIESSPEKTPPEIWEFLRRTLDEQLAFDFEEDGQAHPHEGLINDLFRETDRQGPQL